MNLAPHNGWQPLTAVGRARPLCEEFNGTLPNMKLYLFPPSGRVLGIVALKNHLALDCEFEPIDLGHGDQLAPEDLAPPCLNIRVPFVFNLFSFAKGAKFVDRSTSTGVFFAEQGECQFTKRCARNANPELVIAISPYFFNELTHVLCIQTHRTISIDGQAHGTKVIAFLPI
jgi:hypothetical protein